METVKPGSKYFPLFTHLQRCDESLHILSFQEIENLMDAPLPTSARTSKAFWSNRSSGALQARAWMNAGYHVLDVNLHSQQVTFGKPKLNYEIQKEPIDVDNITKSNELSSQSCEYIVGFLLGL